MLAEGTGVLVNADDTRLDTKLWRSGTASLSTDIDTSLLRGVPAAVVLGGFGAALRRHEFRQEDYLKSTAVEHLDDFISHDWASSALGKTLVLCLIYNSWPAAIASVSVAIVVAALQSGALQVLPTLTVTNLGEARTYGFWCQAIGPLVFAGVFFFWQNIRAALRLHTKMVFLDKYCIDQQDESRKAAGVAGLGGFLKHTDRLVICWTPRYFTRLWCMYEVASWLHLQKSMRQVEFVPLSHATAIVLAGSISCTLCFVYSFVATTVPAFRVYVFLAASVVVLPPAMHQLRRLVHEIRELPLQLDTFSVAASGCFCCEHDHQMPGQPHVALPCDRLVVYETLKTWFKGKSATHESSAYDDSDALLSAFDAEVRNFFGPWVLRKAGPTEVPYSLLMLIGLPFIFRGLDTLVFVGKVSSAPGLRVSLLEFPVIALVILPVIYKSILYFLAWVDSKVGIPRNWCLDRLTSVACSFFPVCMIILTWIPLTYGNSISLALGLVFAVLNCVTAAVVFRRDLSSSSLAARLGCTTTLAAAERRKETANLRVPSPAMLDLEPGVLTPPAEGAHVMDAN